MLSYRPKYNQTLHNFSFRTNYETIENSKAIQIWGYILRPNNDMESQVGTLYANLHHHIYNIKSVTKYTNFSTRYVFIKSIVLGKLD